ncbi:hypothetical protein BKA67DRAFT_583846 [Truncatella angustata]|uniref:Uncharacterized protein n=1 Tax=Truncatella angustata TaxID=152316 RepID=A0A9P8RHV7_9PEZI|nr:uncharacterized protein BKA67DRAFT_583846 [Truncatella angustata]KAH6646313.1 hypothetical protein BKA67DRAFT_583846 [Truncatella angustata]
MVVSPPQQTINTMPLSKGQEKRARRAKERVLQERSRNVQTPAQSSTSKSKNNK